LFHIRVSSVFYVILFECVVYSLVFLSDLYVLKTFDLLNTFIHMINSVKTREVGIM